MIRKDINEVYENLKKTMDAQVEEEQVTLLDAMRAQLQLNIKTEREELRELKELANRMD